MSLRAKLVLALVLLSATATLAIGVWSYAATAARLEAEVDRSLDDAVSGLTEQYARDPFDLDHDGRTGRRPPPSGGETVFGGERPRSFEQILSQAVSAGGQVSSGTATALPVDADDLAVAAATTPGVTSRHDVVVDGEQYRMLTTSLGNGQGAVQVARSVAETDRVLGSIRTVTILAVVAIAALAGAAGWLIARQVTRRLVRLTDAADEVAATGRLDVEVPVTGADEAGRLGTAFNGMLDALAESKEAQQRLVQDAGHELRTPLTSLRTNIEVLARHADLPSETRARVLGDLDAETRELTDLVNELVELATERREDEPEERFGLAEVAERAAERVRRRTGRTVTVTADDSAVVARRGAVERAVGNLVDNAAKFDDGGTAPIEVTVAGGRVEVCDRGPGIPDADLPHVFDRFYRAVEMRSRPGSGLGLSIVRDVAEAHGGAAFASARPGGGACVGFTLPLAN